MRKKRNRNKRILLGVLSILLVSLFLAALLYAVYVHEETGIKPVLGWLGIFFIFAFDILIFAGFYSSSKARRKSGQKRKSSQKSDTYAKVQSKTSDSVAAKNAYVAPTKPQTSKSKTQPKKKGNKPKGQIDLNIRPLDDSSFNIVRNIITTASSIILGTRKEQQDALYVTGTTFFGANENADAFGIVCDGMGGLANGSEASKTAVRIVSNLYAQSRPVTDVNGFFSNAINTAQSNVQDLSASNSDGQRAGTTLVSAIIRNDKLYTASVGDSRIYIIRNGQIKILTRDHNYYLLLKEQLKNGQITEQQLNSAAQKEALISYLGMPELKLVDIMASPLQLVDGDVVLLCSDGLTKALTKEEICNIILENSNQLQSCAEMLTAAAQRKKPTGLDNTSVILLKYN